jgi:hypothetical protein
VPHATVLTNSGQPAPLCALGRRNIKCREANTMGIIGLLVLIILIILILRLL